MENFSTYKETDTNNRYAVTPTVITVTAVTRDEDAYIYKDFGANYFTDFTHTMGPCQFGTDVAAGVVLFWAVSQGVQDANDWKTNNQKAVGLFFTSTTTVQLYDYEAGAADSCAALSVDTDYWFRIVKAAKVVTVDIYSTAALLAAGAAGDVDTLTKTLGTDRAYRYVFAANSYDDDEGAKALSGSFANLELNLNLPGAFGLLGVG